MSENIEVITSDRGHIMLLYNHFKFTHARIIHLKTALLAEGATRKSVLLKFLRKRITY